MSLPVVFRRAARGEFDQAALRYEAGREGLGAAFVAAIDQAVALAAKYPLRHPVIHRNIRRVRARQFPYSVFYLAEKQRVIVLAVFHSSRSPTFWKARG